MKIQTTLLRFIMTRCLPVIFGMLLLVTSCREKYVPQLNEPVTGYLVVEGFINSGSGQTMISLSRSTKISSAFNILRETKATVRVEGKANTAGFALTETSPGVYTHPQLSIAASDQYRIYIKTAAGKEYVSDYSAVRRTPDIDSVAWRIENNGVQIYGNTHNTQQAASEGYYQFKPEETWEFHSRYITFLKIVSDNRGIPQHVGYRDSVHYLNDTSIFKCWKTDTAGKVLVSSTEKLTQNVISMFPVMFIENNSWKLGVRYSMNLKVYSLSRENFHFLEQLRKNTEQLGSIFDAQPSEILGNIHCIGNPTETVIGFVEVSEEKTKRIFIDKSQLPSGFRYISDCSPEVLVQNDGFSIRGYAGQIPTYFHFSPGGAADSVYFASPDCVDCTLKGVNKKPSFW